MSQSESRRTIRDRNQAIWNQFIETTYDELRALPDPEISEVLNRGVVMIEPRLHPHLEYVLRNVMYFLQPGWGLQIFSGNRNFSFLQSLTKGWGEVVLENLGVDNLSATEYNHIKRTHGFWQRIKFDQVLWVEPDCLLRRPGIEDFLGYDYIGAPWSTHRAISPNCRIGNGGLSLRKKTAMLNVAGHANTDARLFAPEDIYFCVNMGLANAVQPGTFRLPALEVAREFSVEEVFHPNPVGLHKTWNMVSTMELEHLLSGISYRGEHAG